MHRAVAIVVVRLQDKERRRSVPLAECCPNIVERPHTSVQFLVVESCVNIIERRVHA